MKVTLPAKLADGQQYPVTLSNIGGDPDNSRTITKAGNVVAKSRDELQALIALGGEPVADDAPDAPAVAG